MMQLLFVARRRSDAKQHEFPRVGGSVGDTKRVPTRTPIAANGAKHNEFPLFCDDRR